MLSVGFLKSQGSPFAESHVRILGVGGDFSSSDHHGTSEVDDMDLQTVCHRFADSENAGVATEHATLGFVGLPCESTASVCSGTHFLEDPASAGELRDSHVSESSGSNIVLAPAPDAGYPDRKYDQPQLPDNVRTLECSASQIPNTRGGKRPEGSLQTEPPTLCFSEDAGDYAPFAMRSRTGTVGSNVSELTINDMYSLKGDPADSYWPSQSHGPSVVGDRTSAAVGTADVESVDLSNAWGDASTHESNLSRQSSGRFLRRSLRKLEKAVKTKAEGGSELVAGFENGEELYEDTEDMYSAISTPGGDCKTADLRTAASVAQSQSQGWTKTIHGEDSDPVLVPGQDGVYAAPWSGSHDSISSSGAVAGKDSSTGQATLEGCSHSNTSDLHNEVDSENPYTFVHYSSLQRGAVASEAEMRWVASDVQPSRANQRQVYKV